MSDAAAHLLQKPVGGMAKRSAARLAAVQALYQIDHSSTSGNAVVEEFLLFRLGDSFDTEEDILPDKKLFTEIVLGVGVRDKDIDALVAASMSNKWTLGRVEFILRAILRAGTYELDSMRGTPARVIINEYVDIAHAFYDGQEAGMVNGILDRISRSLRPNEFDENVKKPADGSHVT